MNWLFLLVAPPFSTADLEFTRIQEEWVTEQCVDVERTLPPAVRLLGSRRWRERQAAYNHIEFAGKAYLPALSRATRAKDAETRRLAQGLIDRLFRCHACEGSGECPACWPEGWKWPKTCDCDFYANCGKCQGGGDLRWEVGFTGYDERGGLFHLKRRKDLFPRIDPQPN